MLKETLISDDLLGSQSSSTDGATQNFIEPLPPKPTEGTVVNLDLITTL